LSISATTAAADGYYSFQAEKGVKHMMRVESQNAVYDPKWASIAEGNITSATVDIKRLPFVTTQAISRPIGIRFLNPTNSARNLSWQVYGSQ